MKTTAQSDPFCWCYCKSIVMYCYAEYS